MGDQWPAVKADPNSDPAKAFGSMPVLRQGDFFLAQSQALSQYASDLAMTAAMMEPSAQHRALDMMIVGAWADVQAAMYGVVFGSAPREGLETKITPTLEGIQRQYKDGPFLYVPKGGLPTLGDLAVYDMVKSPFPGLLALKVDLTNFKKLVEIKANCLQTCLVQCLC